MKGDRDKVYDCTSSNFDGLVAMMQPEDSWVAKWQRISRQAKGIYAVSVSGSLPDTIAGELQAMGITYRPNFRDSSNRQ